jgi:hypothetical protein
MHERRLTGARQKQGQCRRATLRLSLGRAPLTASSQAQTWHEHLKSE